MINRVPVYCDIGTPNVLLPGRSLTDFTATHIQIGLNVAIPASSLCINRRLYKIATHQGGMVTREEKRRGVIVDLLIGLGIPILQMVAREWALWSSYQPFH